MSSNMSFSTVLKSQSGTEYSRQSLLSCLPDPVWTIHKLATWSHSFPFVCSWKVHLFSCSPLTRCKDEDKFTACLLPIYRCKMSCQSPSNKLKDQAYISARISFPQGHSQILFIISSVPHTLIINPSGFPSPQSWNIFWLALYLLVLIYKCMWVCTCVHMEGEKKLNNIFSYLKMWMLNPFWMKNIAPEKDRLAWQESAKIKQNNLKHNFESVNMVALLQLSLHLIKSDSLLTREKYTLSYFCIKLWYKKRNSNSYTARRIFHNFSSCDKKLRSFWLLITELS